MSKALERLLALLDGGGVKYDVLRHPPVYTSQQAADARGTSLVSGAKALIVKAGETFIMFVLPADRKLDSKRVRTALSARKLRFADEDDLARIAGLSPGSIPPFGSLFGLSTWCDVRLADQELINFNAGSHEVSISMSFEDYARIEMPRMADVAQ